MSGRVEACWTLALVPLHAQPAPTTPSCPPTCCCPDAGSYIVSFSLGLGAIPWLIMGELFPAHIRATASSVATLLNWSLSFIVTLCFQACGRA